MARADGRIQSLRKRLHSARRSALRYACSMDEAVYGARQNGIEDGVHGMERTRNKNDPKIPVFSDLNRMETISSVKPVSRKGKHNIG